MSTREPTVSLSYRELSVDDLPAVFALRLSTVENRVTMEELEADYGVTPQSLAEGMKTHVRGWLCEDAGRVVGFSMGTKETGEVTVVAVAPEYEGLGIGKNVLSRVQDWLFCEGHDEVWLWAAADPSVRAYQFYRRLGWRTTGETRHGDEMMRLKREPAKA